MLHFVCGCSWTFCCPSPQLCMGLPLRRMRYAGLTSRGLRCSSDMATTLRAPNPRSCATMSKQTVVSHREKGSGVQVSHGTLVTPPRYPCHHHMKYVPKPTTMFFFQYNENFTWESTKARPGEIRLVSRRKESPLQRLRLFGMPTGYPDSCAEGFRRYFLLSLCSTFVSSFASSIAYQSILNGFLLVSSPQLWMLKDLAPALAAAYLANRVVSYENRPKFWFVVSVVLHNTSIVLEMIIPSVVPHNLLTAAVLTSCVRQSASLMFLVTRASALQHFAVSGNLAELTKKFNSFGIVIYTVSTALGIAYTYYVASLTAQLVTVLFCCGANLVLSYMSMCNIAFRVLNGTTISVILRAYVKEGCLGPGHVLSPREVSDFIGLRMLDVGTHEDSDCLGLLYVNPPVNKINICHATLGEDVLYFCSSGMFLFALWEETSSLSLRERWLRWEKPQRMSRKFLKWFSSQRQRGCAGGAVRQRLVLLVRQECDSLHLLTAYLLAYTALLQNANSIVELRRFLCSCSGEQSLWLKRGSELKNSLQAAGWDVERLALDPLNFRLSSLMLFADRGSRGLDHFAVPGKDTKGCGALDFSTAAAAPAGSD
uniref:Uncharacterized protein TCIL3000_11_15270 n=1 Tax=Trypanosoma congolense (strain IL3000) TaxID=1068625 RepID=G0V2Y7_TRYCI|nr:unnamed protein product [Trypanosoma congolense IL3000]